MKIELFWLKVNQKVNNLLPPIYSWILCMKVTNATYYHMLSASHIMILWVLINLCGNIDHYILDIDRNASIFWILLASRIINDSFYELLPNTTSQIFSISTYNNAKPVAEFMVDFHGILKFNEFSRRTSSVCPHVIKAEL